MDTSEQFFEFSQHGGANVKETYYEYVDFLSSEILCVDANSSPQIL